MIVTHRGRTPKLGKGVWIAPTAAVIGDVELGDDVSVWYGAVIRGDDMPIRIGAGSNIQDNSVIHVTKDKYGTTVGRNVTVGHSVTLHACIVRDGALIGMGSVVLDGSQVGEEALVGAHSLVTPRTVIPPRVLAVGSPARVKRQLTEEELAEMRDSAPHYVALARSYES